MPKRKRIWGEVQGLADQSPAFRGFVEKRKSNSPAYLFYAYWQWLKNESNLDWIRGIESPDDLIKHYDELPQGKPKYMHLDAITQWLRSDVHSKTSSKSKENMLTSIRGFYKANRSDLPRESITFKKSDVEIERIESQTPINLTQLRNIIMRGNTLERAVLLTCFQGGLGVGEFEEFNAKGFDEELKQLLEKNETPLMIKLHRPKTDQVYYSFLGRDAVDAIKLWFKARERLTKKPIQIGEPIFIVRNKKFSTREGSERSLKRGERNTFTPVYSWTIERIMRTLAHETGIEFKQKFDPEKYSSIAQIRYKFHPHELRDVFKSVCTIAGVNPVASEWFLGHDIDRLGYDKSPWIDVEFFKAQYAKVERSINLVSSLGSPIEISEQHNRMSTLEKTIKELQEKLDKFAETSLLEDLEKMGYQRKYLDNIKGQDRILKLRALYAQTFEEMVDAYGSKPTIEQKVIDEEQLAEYLEQGWQFIASLNKSGKCVIKREVN